MSERVYMGWDRLQQSGVLERTTWRAEYREHEGEVLLPPGDEVCWSLVREHPAQVLEALLDASTELPDRQLVELVAILEAMYPTRQEVERERCSAVEGGCHGCRRSQDDANTPPF